MLFYSIFLFFYIFKSDDNFSKNCYFYDTNNKYLYDCRNLILYPENYIDSIYTYNEGKKKVQGKIYFDF